MVITVTCSSCSSSFPVDPAKIPEGGVNARCTQCNSIIRVERPADDAPEPVMDLPPIADEMASPPPVPEAPVVVEEPATTEAPAEPELAPAPDVAEPEPAPPAFDATPAPPPIPDAPEIPDTPDPVAPETPPVQGFTFGKRDPTDKARRLARVLVSDMIMYNAERHQEALAGGTLVEDFEEEIEKSWKEYVEQVGEEMANGEGRAFWTAALNEILAKGKDVF